MSNPLDEANTGREELEIPRWQVALWTVALGAVAGVTGYYTMLTGVSPWDDEGSRMLAIQQYLGGMRIYDEVFSIFGPFYYLYNLVLRVVTASPVTHEATRMSSLIPWVGSSLLSGWMVLRLTRSVVFGAAAVSAVSMRLGFFQEGPGHPQELTLLLLLGFLSCPLWFSGERGWHRALWAMGVTCAALLLTKVNCGVYALLSLGVVVAWQYRASPAWRWILRAGCAACLLLPAALIRNHIEAGWARWFWLIATVSIGAVGYRLMGIHPRGAVDGRAVWKAVWGFLAAVAAVLAVMAYQGVTPATVAQAVVVQPFRVFGQNRGWFVAANFSAYQLVFAPAGLAAAILVSRPGREKWLTALRGAMGAGTLIALVLRVDCLPLAAPFVWLVLRADTAPFARALLAAGTAMATLHAYPVYGLQVRLVGCLLAVCALVCLADWAGVRQWRLQPGRRRVAVAALAAMLAGNAGVAVNRYLKYRALPALELAGSQRIHVDKATKDTLEAMAREVTESCDVIEGLPGLPSFHFWTGKPPVTGLTVGNWFNLLAPEQQQRIVDALARERRACVIHFPEGVTFWNPGKADISGLPLVRYIHEEFRPAKKVGGYELLVRK